MAKRKEKPESAGPQPAAAETALQQARTAKSKAQTICKKIPAVNGIGLTRVGGHYAVKINLEQELAGQERIPREIDGVPVIVQMVGKIRKQAGKLRGPAKSS